MKSERVLTNRPAVERLAYQFVILMGFVSFFGDITYEGGRSIAGPYLAGLGASAALVGLVAGLGEFLGYGLRLVSGLVADRTRAYWPITFLGYGLLFAIPLMAWAGRWEIAALLFILERVGKAIRTPARDTMLSHATKSIGRGWGFALHEAIDQLGAVIGPLIFTAAFLLGGGYQQGFTLLWLPAIVTLILLLIARFRVPVPEVLETPSPTLAGIQLKDGLPRVFWFYALFTFLTVAGFANFQLLSYHFSVHSVVSPAQIPLLYAVAMGVDAVVALIVGKTYDRVGLMSLAIAPLLTFAIPLLSLTTSASLVVVGVVLWGAVMGVQETIMRAAIADLTPMARRGFAYGLFNTIYGGAFFVGGALMGWLYDSSIGLVIAFAIAMQILAVPALFLVRNSLNSIDTGQT